MLPRAERALRQTPNTAHTAHPAPARPPLSRQDERAAAQARLAELETAEDPALLDAIPRAAAALTDANPRYRPPLNFATLSTPL